MIENLQMLSSPKYLKETCCVQWLNLQVLPERRYEAFDAEVKGGETYNPN